MLRKILIPIIICVLVLPVLLLPAVSASEAEYIPLITLEDNKIGVFGNPTTDFSIINENGNNVLKGSGTLKKLFWTGSPRIQYSSYDLAFNFKVTSISSSSTYDLFCYKANSSYTWGLKISINYANNGNTGGYLYVSGINTTEFVSYGTWHSMFINVTATTQVRYSFDNAGLSTPYVMANNPTDGRYGFGNTYTSGSGTVYWDNIIMASRIGSIPIASFDYSPDSGDGLTNFIFTDTSAYDTIPFTNTVYWDFGDGNYTYSSPGGSVNHTYIHAGTYQVVLNCSNRLGYDLAYTNITVSEIVIGTGGVEITDDMFGLVIIILLITALNIIGTKTGYLMISIFAVLGMVFIIPLLWVNAPINISLMMIMVLGNVALLVYGFTRD